MSFKSDVSFPEPAQWNGGQGDARLTSQSGRNQRGPAYRAIKERDTHDMWAALRQFRAQYGDTYLQTVIDDAKRNPL